MPRRIERPHPWRSALVIFACLVLLAIVAAIMVRFGFTPYDAIDNLPEDPAMLERE
jgi:hypothetical protein